MTTVEFEKLQNRKRFGVCHDLYTKEELEAIDRVLRIASELQLLVVISRKKTTPRTLSESGERMSP